MSDKGMTQLREARKFPLEIRGTEKFRVKSTYGWIYCITHRKSEKQYIGRSRKPIHRFWQHIESNDTQVSKAITVHGMRSFDFDILEACGTKQELYEAEERHIKMRNTYWPNGYNLTYGGDDKKKVLGRTLTDDLIDVFGFFNPGGARTARMIRRAYKKAVRSRLY